MRLAFAAVALCLPLAAPAAAQETCRQALVFALDVSGSVDEAEYRQQLDGVAGALQDPEVQAAILADDDVPMAVAAFEWSSESYSALIVDWTILRTDADVAEVAERLRGWGRRTAPTETGIGTGLRKAAALLQRAPDCWEMTVDVSSDGKNNDGPSPVRVRQEGLLEGTTVNALVVGNGGASSDAKAAEEIRAMEVYLKENVVGGPGSFVAVAQSYGDYLHAMRRKLLKEIATVPTWRGPTTPGARRVTSPG
jgi:hypothetical protein